MNIKPAHAKIALGFKAKIVAFVLMLLMAEVARAETGEPDQVVKLCSTDGRPVIYTNGKSPIAPGYSNCGPVAGNASGSTSVGEVIKEDKNKLSYGEVEQFDIESMKLSVPAPNGYVRVTEQMPAVYRLSQQMKDLANDTLAYYISTTDQAAALKGKIPPLNKTFLLKVNKAVKKRNLSKEDFRELAEAKRTKKQEITDSIKSALPGLFEDINRGLKKDLGIDSKFSVSDFMELEPHHDTDKALAYSMYIKMAVSIKDKKYEQLLAATLTMLNVSGKVLSLYCYAPKKDLEWTRTASEAWANSIISSNPPPPSHSAKLGGVDWKKYFSGTFQGAVIGGIIGILVFAVGKSLTKTYKATK